MYLSGKHTVCGKDDILSGNFLQKLALTETLVLLYPFIMEYF